MVMVMVMTMIMEGTQKQKGKEKGKKGGGPMPKNGGWGEKVESIYYSVL